MLTGWLASGGGFPSVSSVFCGTVTLEEDAFSIFLWKLPERGRPFLKESLIKAYPCQVGKDTLKGCRGMEMRKSIYTEQRRSKSLGRVGKAPRMSSIPRDHLVEGIPSNGSSSESDRFTEFVR
ncbi:hypothetical protein PUN28_004449 [Cardiocondyla obscurior]|uniref:Uncharacterized protein n=1 Tax=Cardiocondyla obscurior TaxID=286306 RepID=A0AAW2GCQ3_9HYME